MIDLFGMTASDAVLSPCAECPGEATREECVDPRHRPWRALRTTDPRELAVHPDPIGPENDDHLALIADEVAEIVPAWGDHPTATERAAKVLRLLATHDHAPKCFGLTKGGQPKHPLYVKVSTPLIELEA